MAVRSELLDETLDVVAVLMTQFITNGLLLNGVTKPTGRIS
jgi:hypothetical protein